MEDDSAFKYRDEKPVGGVFMDLIFSHLGLFVVVSLYTCFGAYVFIQLEQDAEKQRYLMKQYAAISINETIDYTTQLIWFYGDPREFNFTFTNYSQRLGTDLDRMETYILDAVSENQYDGTVYGWSYDWTFMNSLLLCMSILATIGYGNITPVTFEGQMFCIGYAIVGCPLFLGFVAGLGSAMARGFTYIYSRCCCRCCRSKRYASELPENVSKRYKKHVIDDIVGEEEYMNTTTAFVPITVNIVVLHLYFLIGAMIFSNWEDWDLMPSFYFTFVTLSTIGYGDYVPGDSLTDSPDSLSTSLKLFVSVLFIVVGISLLSMCINLMQQQIVSKCQNLSRKLGCSKDDEVCEPNYMDQRKDSLMPLMQDTKGSSPFRSSEGQGSALGDRRQSRSLPGIIVAE